MLSLSTTAGLISGKAAPVVTAEWERIDLHMERTLTPCELLEPMGLQVYGCDLYLCQEVSQRNQPWLAQQLSFSEGVAAKIIDLNLSNLLHMDRKFFKNHVWPICFTY